MAQSIGIALGVAAATAGCYWMLLGWGRRTATGPNAYLHSPAPASNVALLIVLLGVVALAVGWLGRPIVGSIALAAVLTTCWTTDAALNVPGDRNWPMGTTLVAWASLGGALMLSGAVAEVRLRLRRREEVALLAEQARQLAAARAAEQARLAAERAAALARAQAEAEQAQRRREAAARELAAREAATRELAVREAAAREAAAAQSAPSGSAKPGDRKAKVVQAVRTSAARVRANSGRPAGGKGRAKAG